MLVHKWVKLFEDLILSFLCTFSSQGQMLRKLNEFSGTVSCQLFLPKILMKLLLRQFPAYDRLHLKNKVHFLTEVWIDLPLKWKYPLVEVDFCEWIKLLRLFYYSVIEITNNSSLCPYIEDIANNKIRKY